MLLFPLTPSNKTKGDRQLPIGCSQRADAQVVFDFLPWVELGLTLPLQ